jgi:sec-independent protein translocase protein TatA
MGLSFSHLLLVLVIVLIVFGKGRISSVMGEIGKGVRSMRDGLKGDETKEEK